MNRNLLAAIGLVLVVGLGAWATTESRSHKPPPPLPTLYTLSDFSLTDQQGRTVTRASLQGHPLVIDFMFTTCTEFCSEMTDKLGKIRTALGPGSDTRCISISVDPEHDTPAVLRRFAVAHHANDPRWLFLTGSRRTVGTLLQSLFLAPSGDPTLLSPSLHSRRFVLVDGRSVVRGFYDDEDPESRQRIVADARSLETRPTR